MRKGLVLEGGGMRGLFTAGVLDVMMEQGICFDGIVGVFGLTTVDWRKNHLVERLARSARLLSGEETWELKDTGEEGVAKS